MPRLTKERMYARQCAYDEAIEHLRDAAGADPDLLEPHESDEMRALADRLDAELNRMVAKRVKAARPNQ